MKVYGNSNNGIMTNFFNETRKLNRKQNILFSQLSSGERITNFSIDPAGGAIAKKLEASFKQYQQEINNIQDEISKNQVIDSGYGQINDTLQEIRRLQIQAKNDTLTDDQRAIIQQQIDLYTENIKNIIRNTEFNEKTVLETGGNLEKALKNGISINDSLDITDNIINEVIQKQAEVGANTNSLVSQIKEKSIAFENTVAAYSGIADFDIAQGLIDMTTNHILEQSSLATIKNTFDFNKESVINLLNSL